MKQFEYRIAIATGLLQPKQLEELGSEGWELTSIIRYPFKGVEHFWHYFKKEKISGVTEKKAGVIQLFSRLDRGDNSTDGGKGSDDIGVKKE
jgi:hypothetical protein